MNKIYKVIWSKVKNSYVVVPEIAASSSKNKGNKAYKSALAAVLTAMLGFGGFVGSEAATVNDGDTLNRQPRRLPYQRPGWPRRVIWLH